MLNKFFSKFKFVLFSIFFVGFSVHAFANESSNKVGYDQAPLKHARQASNNGLKRKKFTFISQKLTKYKLPKDLALTPILETRPSPYPISANLRG
jgi:hypothetical protein